MNFFFMVNMLQFVVVDDIHPHRHAVEQEAAEQRGHKAEICAVGNAVAVQTGEYIGEEIQGRHKADRTQKIKQADRVEVGDKIFLPNALYKAFEQQHGNRGYHLFDAHLALLTYRINGFDRYFAQAAFVNVQLNQYIVGHPVGRVDFVQLQFLQGAQRDGGIACLGVADKPVAAL